MKDEVAERLTRLETTIAHLEHLTEQLNGVVTEQGRELDQLKKRLQRQAQSLETIEMDRIRSTNSKPPHYQ
jgi:SlyX protein